MIRMSKHLLRGILTEYNAIEHKSNHVSHDKPSSRQRPNPGVTLSDFSQPQYRSNTSVHSVSTVVDKRSEEYTVTHMPDGWTVAFITIFRSKLARGSWSLTGRGLKDFRNC